MNQASTRVLLNDQWSFALDTTELFTPVSLPHDWLIQDLKNQYRDCTGWYSRELDASSIPEECSVSLHFDGVYMDSTLYVNGVEAGTWKYGYTAFEHDIGNLLYRDKLNTLLLKVDYKTDSGRWYTGAGIYRDVHLIIQKPCHIIPESIYIHTEFRDGTWQYEAEAQAVCPDRNYSISHELLEATSAPREWSPENPALYTLRSTLTVDGTVIDFVDTKTGFRSIEFTPDRGLLLNGKRIKLFGVCLHHDLGALGTAVHKEALRRQLLLLKKMGVNAIRTAHNPPASCFMDLCDELGFLVVSELLDVWKESKNKNDYAQYFDEWIERDSKSWILRDRNHPSLLLWSIGNEIADTHKDAKTGAETLRKLLKLVQSYDPKQNARPTLCSNYMPWENTQHCADIIKIIGYNYGEALYEQHHAEHPDWIIYGSETCSTVQSRGIYHFPLNKSILSDDDLQCSALGNSATSWGAKSVESCIKKDLETEFSLGQFIWAGQDYIGEPTPYHTKNSYLGHIDTAGFPKDSYYIFQAAWTDYREAPMVHLFPYWDFSPGQLVDVRVCSNAPQVELFLNDISLGCRNLENNYITSWTIPYEKGSIRAVAYDKKGNPVAGQTRTSFADPVRLRIKQEKYGSLIFCSITAEDEDGNCVENAVCRVLLTVQGGKLLGMDNGDSTDQEAYQSSSRRMFSGRLLAIVQCTSSDKPLITASIDQQDRPIRKIELMRKDAYNVEARIYPDDAVYDDLHWRLCDAGGVDSPLGSIKVGSNKRHAEVIPRGDGEVYVRCCAENGKGHISLISQISMQIDGFGKPFLDPYMFISAALYSYSNVELTNGNERGVATQRKGESHIGFRDLDFGPYGSDTIVLPLFPLEKEPFEFEIWEGMPLEGGSLIARLVYDKGSIWNTYQETLYKLPRRLKGITSICLVFRQKVHVKGFCFTRYKRAYQRLEAADCDSIYGDSYELDKDIVKNIGNNVTLVFRDLQFGDQGTDRIELCWRSSLRKNSVQILFENTENAIKTMFELPESESWITAHFNLNQIIQGSWTVSLIFLPGSSLDLSWIHFKKTKEH